MDDTGVPPSVVKSCVAVQFASGFPQLLLSVAVQSKPHTYRVAVRSPSSWRMIVFGSGQVVERTNAGGLLMNARSVPAWFMFSEKTTVRNIATGTSIAPSGGS